MENASKALIIAGAILLSILIISLGIMIFNQASGVVNNNAMDELEVTQFNQKFSQYFGNNVRGANVNALINAVKVNNNSQDDDSKKISITMNGTTYTSDKISTVTKAATGKTYKVEDTAWTTAGLISTITITENK